MRSTLVLVVASQLAAELERMVAPLAPGTYQVVTGRNVEAGPEGPPLWLIDEAELPTLAKRLGGRPVGAEHVIVICASRPEDHTWLWQQQIRADLLTLLPAGAGAISTAVADVHGGQRHRAVE